VARSRVPTSLLLAFVLALVLAGCGAAADREGGEDPASDSANAGASGGSADASPWHPVEVDVWADAQLTSSDTAEYTPVGEASQPWEICVSFPHLKDAYWLGVNYGAAEQAEEAEVNMVLVEAGGYENLDRQIQQIEDCSQSADAVVVGSISLDGLNTTIDRLAERGIPVIDVINGISSDEVAAKSLVSFGEMATRAGEWLADETGGEEIDVAWFPGPPGAGWVEAGDAGFKAAVDGTSINVVDTKFGDTGREVQSQLIEDALAANPDLDYIVGTAVTAEAAVPILRDRGLTDQIGVVAYYFTPGVHQGLQDGTILAAPSDSMVIQARIAIDQAIRVLEDKPLEPGPFVGPRLFVVDGDNVADFDRDTSLAPDGFQPVFEVKAGS
jgi:protein TorT